MNLVSLTYNKRNGRDSAVSDQKLLVNSSNILRHVPSEEFVFRNHGSNPQAPVEVLTSFSLVGTSDDLDYIAVTVTHINGKELSSSKTVNVYLSDISLVEMLDPSSEAAGSVIVGPGGNKGSDVEYTEYIVEETITEIAALTAFDEGTAGTGVTASTTGDGVNFTTVLTISATDALTLADNAAIADGHAIFTFPAGSILVGAVTMSVGVTAASTELQADTPDVGLGTLVGSGAVATLNLVDAAAENIITGQTAADANGTATVASANPSLIIATGDSHVVYLNVADTWADDTGGDLTADIAGTVTINWTKIS